MAFVLVSGCAHTDPATGGASPSPSATARPAPVHVVARLPAGPAARSATLAVPDATSAPVPAPAPATPSGPQIISLSVTPAVVHAGGAVAFSARTTADITNVTAFVSAYTLPFTRTSPGRFSLAFAIPPNVPGLFHGTYTMNVVAKSTAGSSVSRTIAVTFQ